MIDWERVRELRGDVGDDDFRSILELFLDEIETVVFRLAGNSPQQNSVDFHFLTGCARNLGFNAFARLCEELEALSKQNQISPDRIEGAMELYARTKRSFICDLERKCRGHASGAA